MHGSVQVVKNITNCVRESKKKFQKEWIRAKDQRGERNERHGGVKTEIFPPVRSVNVSCLNVKKDGDFGDLESRREGLKTCK